MGKKSRNKGKRGELEIAHIMQEHGFNAHRGQQFSGLQGDADVVGVPYLHLEVKRVQALNLDKAMAQSVRDARDGEIPVVVHRKDKQEWRITLSLEDFMPMFKAWIGEQIKYKFSSEPIENGRVKITKTGDKTNGKNGNDSN